MRHCLGPTHPEQRQEAVRVRRWQGAAGGRLAADAALQAQLLLLLLRLLRLLLLLLLPGHCLLLLQPDQLRLLKRTAVLEYGTRVSMGLRFAFAFGLGTGIVLGTTGASMRINL